MIRLVCLLILTFVLTGCGTWANLLAGTASEMVTSTIPEPMRVSLDGAYRKPLPVPERDRFVPGWQTLHEYRNTKDPFCGQAATAMILDHAGLNPLGLPLTVPNPADGRLHPENDAFVKGIAKAFPPDLAFGLAGSSPARLAMILQTYGMRSHISTSGDFGGLRTWVEAGWPVAALVNAGYLWNQALVLHWVVVYRIDADYVWVGNPLNGQHRIAIDKFMGAWECKGFPIKHALVAAELP